KEVCYDRLGCFSDDSPWAGIIERPLKVLPWSPEEVNTRFLLYTNENPDNFQNLFTVESVNCICVDWKGGSRTGYTQATQNIRIVGAEVAYLVDVLKSSFEYSLSDVHVIGHSLGAHAAGEAGRRTNGAIGRITGLDPAEPCFEGTPELVRLDPSDAQFVDVIHTDAAPIIPNLGFGMSQVVGHLDFFPNGGKEMPGSFGPPISKLVLGGMILVVVVDKCFPCPSDGCPQMGHYADRFPGKTKSEGQTFYLNTGDASNFARWRYKVAVTLSGRRVTGHILVSLFGDKGNSKQYEIFNGTLKPDNTESSEFDSDVEVGVLQKVKFLWYNNVINPTLPKVGASKISVETNDGQVFDFCSQDTVREEVLLTLNP
ncbi:PNLIP, partial [Cervus elaphus hippelaphus]